MSAPAVAAMLGTRVDLLALDTSKRRPWTRGAPQITRPGLRSIWFGPRGSAKSLAALLLAVQVIDAGGSAIYLDLENGPRRQAERLAAILADRPPETRAAVSQRLDYRPDVRLAKLTGTTVAEWAALFDGHDLAVIDSTARALGQLGLDENLTSDFARLMVAHVDPPAERGTSFVLLDNTGHEALERPRGGSGKLDLCELAYRVSCTDIALDKAGTITLERTRTRDGDEARQLIAHVGDGTYTPLHVPPVSERQAAVVEAILSYLEQNPGSTTEEVAKGIGIRKQECRSQLSILETPRTGSGTVSQCPSQVRDRRGTPHTRKGWYLAEQSQLATVPQARTGADRQSPGLTGGPGPPSPLRDGTGAKPDHIAAEHEAIGV
jgi:hypothetical protein